MNIQVPDSITIIDHEYIALPDIEIILVTTKHLYDKYKKHLRFQFSQILFLENNEVTHLNELKSTIPISKILERQIYLVGFGGGKVIDATKYLAKELRLNYISIPTTLSNDGICSPVIVISHKQKQLRIDAYIPSHVIIPLKIIEQAPVETIIAGFGDILSNFSALKDWKLAQAEVGEKINTYAYYTSSTAVQSVFFYLSTLYETGKVYEMLSILATSLIMSGISMGATGNSRPSSGGEHLFSHTLDNLYPDNKVLHGYKVAFGVLITEILRGNDIKGMQAIFQKVGLPTTTKDFPFSESQLIFALMSILDENRDRYTIFNKIRMTKEKAKEVIGRLK